MPRKTRASDKEAVPADDANGAAGNGSAVPTAKKRKSPQKKMAKSKDENVGVAAPEVSDEAIRIRAYFIAEERARLALPGDADSDWLEARRQLLAELARS